MTEWLVKDPDTLQDRWGKRPSDRTTGELLEAGVIVLDKPRGPTSHQAAAWARDALHTERISHGGTLDPKVSGVLPVVTGKAVRLTDVLLSSDKEYVCSMRLHGDRDGKEIRKVFSGFEGTIRQTPPARSSVKRKPRTRTVKELEILEIEGRDVLFRVSCDAGTYIRTLCTDIGDALGCGANMAELRRTRSGRMTEKDAVSLQDLRDAYIFWQEKGRENWLRSMVKPVEYLTEPLPKIVVKPTAVDAVCHGADLTVSGIHKLEKGIRRNSVAAMVTARGELIGIGKTIMSSPKIMASEKGTAVKTERVIMEPGHYPKMWKFSTDLH